MNDDPLKPYREAIRTYGGGFESTLWGSPQTQALRFEVLAEMLGETLVNDVNILDLGCGDGAFAQWLRDVRGVHARVHGLDAMGEMIEAATARDIQGATFEVCNLIDSVWPVGDGVDLVVLSGTLNTMPPATAQGLLQQAWTHVGVALVFNFLGDAPSAAWRDRPLGPSRRHSVEAMEAWARSRCGRLELRSDYLDGHDVTMCMWRDRPSQP